MPTKELNEVEKLNPELAQNAQCSPALLHRSSAPKGFIAQMRDYLDRIELKSGILCRLDSDVDELELDDIVESEVMSICLEAIGNAVKHSKAEHLDLHLHIPNGYLRVEISDDGQGFKQGRGGSGDGLGLIIMRERAELVGGHLRLKSDESKGTSLILEIPSSWIRKWGKEKQQRPSRWTFLYNGRR